MPAKQKNTETSKSAIRWDVVGGRKCIEVWLLPTEWALSCVATAAEAPVSNARLYQRPTRAQRARRGRNESAEALNHTVDCSIDL